MARLVLSPVVAGIMRLPQWSLSAQGVAQYILSCMDLGIDCFDAADIYGSYTAEKLFGEGVRLLTPSQRLKLKIISKCGIQLVSANRPHHQIKSYNTDPEHIKSSVQQSLRDLGVEKLYALLIHRPDHLSEPEKIVNTVTELQSQGLIHEFGLSNHSIKQVEYYHSLKSISAHQIEWSPLHCDPLFDDSLVICQKLNITPMIWSPIAQGRSLDSTHESTSRWWKDFEKIAQQLQLSPLSLTIAWLHRHPSKPVAVMGTRELSRLKEAIIGSSFRMESELWYRLLTLFTGKEIP